MSCEIKFIIPNLTKLVGNLNCTQNNDSKTTFSAPRKRGVPNKPTQSIYKTMPGSYYLKTFFQDATVFNNNL